jgi:PPOX class probable F420-dependent enzyme
MAQTTSNVTVAYDPSMPTTTTPLPDHVRAFLAEPRYAAIATVDADGAPRQAVIWYLLDGDTIVINSLEGRLWPTNLRRDPRVSIAVTAVDREDWVGLTGSVEVVDDPEQAQADIAAMARRYHHAHPEAAEELIESRFRPQQRVSFRLAPTRIHDHIDGD